MGDWGRGEEVFVRLFTYCVKLRKVSVNKPFG